MKKHDPEIRRHLLKPLIRRTDLPAKENRIETAFSELEQRALANSLLPEIAIALKKDRSEKDTWRNPDSAKLRIQLAAALYLSRLISFQEYIFFVAHAAESVHEGRILDGVYPELVDLFSSMRDIELSRGLTDDEFFPLKDAPPEYQRLNDKWVLAEDKRLGETLVVLEGALAATLFQNNRDEFDRLRERGRRAIFHKQELISALKDTIKRYEQEAQESAKVKAFTAAVSLLGAAMEGLLLLRCLLSKTKACKTAKELQRRKRPRDPNTPTEWSFNNLIHVCLYAGWLPDIQTPSISIKPDRLAHILREMRNYIHPGRVCIDRPWVEAEQRNFDDAEVIYTTLYATVFESKMLKKYAQEEHK